MKTYYYYNWKTQEEVFEDEAFDYALEKLGLTMTPKGTKGTFTIDQKAFIEMIQEWYFDNDWSKKEWKEDEGDIFAIIKESCELEGN